MRPEIQSPVGELQRQYVRVRIVNMADVDVGLFDFDFDTTLSLFVLNHEKNIYLRYGARSDASADAMLTGKSLQVALERGLAMHQKWKSGDLELPPPPAPVPAKSFPNIRNIVEKGQCVHCHQVADGKAQAMIALDGFDKKKMPWIYPDPVNLGLILDPDDGTRIKDSRGAAADAGIKPSEQIQRIGDRIVNTFADVQHALHHLPLESTSVSLTTDRATRRLELPDYWRVTDITRRSIGHRISPFPEFWGATLDAAEKEKLGVDPRGFATRVTRFWGDTNGKRAGLQEGDVVIAVDGETASPLAQNAIIYIRTHFETGDEIRVRYRRGGTEATATFKLREKPW